MEHIVLSHAYPHNIGGLGDFPAASVHALPSATVARLFRPSVRPVPQVAHVPRYVPPTRLTSDWHGFTLHRLAIDTLEIHLVELSGSASHQAGVLIRYDAGFVFYVGDAIASVRDLLDAVPPTGPRQWLRILQDAHPFESLVTRDRLRCLARRPPTTLTFVFGRGTTARISVGPSPYPSIGCL